ncbi:substrate-binding domain-containing protein [Fusibacter bizertensis]
MKLQLKVIKSVVLIVILVLVLTSCNSTEKDGEVILNEDEITTDALYNDNDEILSITCAASEGLASYSLTKLLYEQPDLLEHVVLDYTLFNDLPKLKEALASSEPSIAVLPFTLAVEVLNQTEDYRLLGVVKGNNHLLLGIQSLSDVKGKAIKVYDPSGFEGVYSSSIKRLRHSLALNGMVLDRDYTLSFVDKMEDMVPTEDNQLMMIEEVYLNYDEFKSFKSYVTLDETEDYQLAVIVLNAIDEVYPDLAKAFEKKYYDSCLWLSAFPDEAVAYANQINTTQTSMPVRSMYYFAAKKCIDQITQMLDWLGYRQEVKDLIEKRIYWAN